MREVILSKLEASRKELLDLGLRNPLLNYKISKSKGVKVVQEKSASVYEILVSNGKSMSFIPNENRKGDLEGDDLPELPELNDGDLQSSYTDTKLQTLESEQSLQKRLLNTYYEARLILEEQGVNVLYLALGGLEWFESESSEEKYYAPLILIPVKLERSNAGERFKLSYTGAEIEFNLSLQAKLKAEYGIALPAFKDGEDSLSDYFHQISKAVSGLKRWTIDSDAITLGFFSFGKFMLYNDLDANNWSESEKPQDYPLLSALLQYGFSEPDSSVSEGAFIDDEQTVQNLFQVVDADGSQVLAMQAVDEGRNLVIQGPPGTGKSQTITNIIANAIGKGKKVLFVAEKMAALEVVKRRLDSVNLGDACLELHSHKANKKDLHNELRRVLELGKPNIKQLEQDVLLLDEFRNILNEYCKEINTEIARSGMSPNQIFGLQLALLERTKELDFPKLLIPEIDKWNIERVTRVNAFVERIMAKLKDIGIPSQSIFWGVSLKTLLPSDQQEISNLINSSIELCTALETDLRKAGTAVGLNNVTDKKGFDSLQNLLQIAKNSPDLKDIAIKRKEWESDEKLISETIAIGRKASEIKSRYSDLLLDNIWNFDLFTLRKEFISNGRKWWKFLIPSYKQANKTLLAFCKTEMRNYEKKLQVIDDVVEYQRLYSVVNEHGTMMQDCFQRQWSELRSQWDNLQKAATYLAEVHKAANLGDCPTEIFDYISLHKPSQESQLLQEGLRVKYSEYYSELNKLLEKLQYSKGFTDLSFLEQLTILKQWKNNIATLHQVVAWNNLVEDAEKEQLTAVIEIASSWDKADIFLKDLVLKTWYEYLISKVFTDSSAIRKFESATHEDVALKYRKLDILNQHFHIGKIALEHYNFMPKLNAGGQMNVLRTEFNKKSKHLPIRKLIQEAGQGIQAIKPVFMMSPISIANFLPPGSVKFDLVIFDEASQVKPVDAFGAILRGKQLVVVGDSKQMPPTSFFDRGAEVDEEDNVTADLPSILGLCDAQGAPNRMLRWHYRSKHESLISVSNHEFYENKLVIFPSPGSKTRLGLMYHLLNDTYYDRGKTRSNPLEAQAVAEAVMQHAKNNPKQSLGVVAFSTSQKEAIQDALEIKRRLHPEVENFFNPRNAEPFFVKNLENVQGDERDVIFISIGYGKTQEGYISMSFGPINNEGGERRLNVLITRAKLRCEVFTNLVSDDIDLNKSQKRGVRALKSFLQFAQKGILDIPEETGKEADSPFEEMVAQKLRAHGYNIKNQVGSKGFFIDLAVVDPENPGRYILGIECDGAAYHSAKSARDRDRLRQQVLEGMGWKFYRVWSTDWFRNTDKELQKIIRAIEDARNLTLLEDEAIAEEDALIQAELLRENKTEVEQFIAQYQIAAVSTEISKQEIHLHSTGKLAEWIEEIVRVESPIHFDEMAKRMAMAAGVAKVGTRIRESLSKAANFASSTGRIRHEGKFLWHHTMIKPIIRNRELLPASSKKIGYIAPAEIELAVIDVVANAIAIENDAIIPLTAKIFGFLRVTDEIKVHIQKAIDDLIRTEHLIVENNWLKLKTNKN